MDIWEPVTKELDLNLKQKRLWVKVILKLRSECLELTR
jgi:hypothetical protein